MCAHTLTREGALIVSRVKTPTSGLCAVDEFEVSVLRLAAGLWFTYHCRRQRLRCLQHFHFIKTLKGRAYVLAMM